MKARSEKEKKVVLGGNLHGGDTPDDLVHDMLSEVSSGCDPLDNLIGQCRNRDRFPPEELFRYKNQFYVPSNVVIAIAGKLPDDYKERVEEAFGD